MCLRIQSVCLHYHIHSAHYFIFDSMDLILPFALSVIVKALIKLMHSCVETLCIEQGFKTFIFLQYIILFGFPFFSFCTKI